MAMVFSSSNRTIPFQAPRPEGPSDIERRKRELGGTAPSSGPSNSETVKVKQ